MIKWIQSNLNILGISLVAFLAPIKPLMLTIGLLVAVDFIFGIYRAWKTGQEITSRKMSNTITKMLLYNITIITIWALEQNIIGNGIPITKIAAGMICTVEFKSIDETFTLLFGFSLWNKIKGLIQRKESETK